MTMYFRLGIPMKREYLQERLPHLDLMYGKITTIGVVVLDLMFSKALDGLTDEMDDLNDEDEDRKNRLNFFLMRFKVECGENELIGAFNTTTRTRRRGRGSNNWPGGLRC